VAPRHGLGDVKKILNHIARLELRPFLGQFAHYIYVYVCKGPDVTSLSRRAFDYNLKGKDLSDDQKQEGA
jgi:hypothetical protein